MTLNGASLSLLAEISKIFSWKIIVFAYEDFILETRKIATALLRLREIDFIVSRTERFSFYRNNIEQALCH